MSLVNYIPIGLKVIEVHAPTIARASGHTVTHILGALSLLWHRVFSTKQEVIARITLAGVFGPDNLDTIVEACVSEGILEPITGGWRIKGADHFKRVAEARSRGGKAAAGNLIPGARQKLNSLGSSREAAESQPRESLGSLSALTPNTEKPRSREADTGGGAGPAVDRPSPDSAIGFWVACQDKREAAGLQRERPPGPKLLDHWFSQAMGEVHGDEQKLLKGFDLFLVNPWWRNEAEKPCAWGGWVSQWRDFVTKATAPPVAAPAPTRNGPAPVPDWSDAEAGEIQL